MSPSEYTAAKDHYFLTKKNMGKVTCMKLLSTIRSFIVIIGEFKPSMITQDLTLFDKPI